MAGNEGTSVLARLYQDDGLYEGGAHGGAAPAHLHRQPRFRPARVDHPSTRARASSDEELLERVMLSNAMLFLLRGVPVVYYGDEQGFVGHGIDQDSRQDMFASQVAELQRSGVVRYRRAPRRCANFNPQHPLYAQIAGLAKLRRITWRCGAGARWCVRMARRPDCLPSRGIGNDGREIVVAFNTSMETAVAQIEVEPGLEGVQDAARRLRRQRRARRAASGVEVPPLGYVGVRR